MSGCRVRTQEEVTKNKLCFLCFLNYQVQSVCQEKDVKNDLKHSKILLNIKITNDIFKLLFYQYSIFKNKYLAIKKYIASNISRINVLPNIALLKTPLTSLWDVRGVSQSGTKNHYQFLFK